MIGLCRLGWLPVYEKKNLVFNTSKTSRKILWHLQQQPTGDFVALSSTGESTGSAYRHKNKCNRNIKASEMIEFSWSHTTKELYSQA